MPVEPGSIQGFGGDGSRAKCWKCPKDHMLEPWLSAGDGACDGCGQPVCNGERVMDCRRCNWYLCERCHPQEREPSLWDTIAAALDDMSALERRVSSELGALASVITCSAPDKEEMESAEIQVGLTSAAEGHHPPAADADAGALEGGGSPRAGSHHGGTAADSGEGQAATAVQLEAGGGGTAAAAPAAAAEENLIDFEPEDLLDFSDEKGPPSPAPAAAPTDRGLSDIFEVAPSIQQQQQQQQQQPGAPASAAAAAAATAAPPPPAAVPSPTAGPLLLLSEDSGAGTAAGTRGAASAGGGTAATADLLVFDDSTPSLASQAASPHERNLIEVF